MHFTHHSKKCLLGHCDGLIVKRLRDNGILEVYLVMEAHISSATQIIKKEPKETTKRKANIPNHNGPEVNLQLNT